MGIFSNLFFWSKNILFRKNAFIAYRKSISYCKKSIDKRFCEDFIKRRSLVEYAYKHCKFYHEYYNSRGFNPSMLKEEKDWQLVPIIEKQMIRDYIDDFVSNEFKKSKLGEITTGGSTGKPLKIYKSPNVHYEVLAWRALKWWNVSPADNEAIIHRKVPIGFMQTMKNRLLWWPTKRAYLSAKSISEENIKNFIQDIKKNKIKWIVGYCAAIEYVADYILKNKIQVDGIDLIWSTSSPLTKIVRNKIETAFNCKVMDQYGCCEMGNIAIQKPGEDYLTINSDYVHVDIVDLNNSIINDIKEYGDVLITELKTFEFPLIKYRLGDKSKYVKTMKESHDGFPKMEFVRGRISDAVWLPDGTYIDGAYLTTICDNYSDYIACYQIIQDIDYSIQINFIPKQGEFNFELIKDEIIRDFLSLTKGKVIINHSTVSKISDFEGKRKFIISKISLSKV